MMNFKTDDLKIQENEKKMIQKIIDFRELRTHSALIPLIKVDALSEDSSIEEAIEKFKMNGHSRMPLYRERIDHIVGMLEVKDLFLAKDPHQKVSHYAKPVRYIAESQRLESILGDFTQENPMLIVVDEHGGSVGIVTFEDLIEEIVGEIDDEHDPQTQPIRFLSHHRWLISASSEIALINESLKLSLPEGEEYETLGGLLIELFGKIPKSGSEKRLDTTQGIYFFKVQSANERHVHSAIVEYRPSES